MNAAGRSWLQLLLKLARAVNMRNRKGETLTTQRADAIPVGSIGFRQSVIRS